jgi:Fe-S cluster biosynthesis and repair protein YggX
MATVQCVKCGVEGEALSSPPFRAGTKLAALGTEIQAKICGACYREWIAMSVKLVNETRMDTTDPRGQQLWLEQMRTFLGLDPEAGVTAVATLIGAEPDRLNFADFAGGAVPSGFVPSATGARGSASIARDAVKTLEPAT